MSRIKGIVIELDGDTRKLSSALRDVNKNVKDSQKELKQIERLLKFNPRNTELLAQKQKLLAQTVEGTRKKLDALKQAQAQVNEQFRKGEISEEQYRKFQRELVETESKLKHYEAQLKKIEGTQKGFAQRMAESGEQIKKVGQNMQQVGRSLNMYVTAPLTALGAVAGKIGMDFKAGLSEVQAISGATATDLERLEVKARELGSSTKFSASEVTQGFKYMAMAGWDVEQSIAAIDGVLSLAAASGEDLALVSDIVTDGMTAFGLAADQAGRFSDVLASASSNANTNVAMLGESFKYVAPVAGSLGYSIEDTALALGLMANAGIKASSAGTALRSALTNMVKPTAAMEKEMKNLGINIKDSNGEMKPMEVLLRDLRSAFSGLTEDQKASAAATIFGKEAMAGMLAIINASDDDFNKLSKSINESEGAAKQMADTMQDNLKGSLTNLKSALEELAIKVYDNLEPMFKSIVGGAQDVVDRLNNMSPAMQKVAVAVGILAASLGPLLTIGGTILVGVGHFMTLLPTLMPLISGLAGPIGLVVGALGALAVAYALTSEKADESTKAALDTARANNDLAQSHLETAESIKENVNATSEMLDKQLQAIESTDGLINKFDALMKKNKLTNDELGEYLTLQTELANTTAPESVEKLKDRMEELRKKSGLTREEFNELISTNEGLLALYPELGTTVDDYGNKLMTATDKVRDLTAAEQERLAIEIYSKMLDDLEEMNRQMIEYEGILDRVLEAEERSKGLTKEQSDLKKDIQDYTRQISDIEAEIIDKKSDSHFWDTLTSFEYQKQHNELIRQKSELEGKKKKAEENLKVTEETLSVEQDTLDTYKKTKDEIGQTIQKNQENLEKYMQIKKEQLGINLEKGNEIKSIETAIKKEQEKLNKLQEQIKKEGDVNGEKQKQVDKTNEQIRKLNEAKTEIQNLEGKQKNVNAAYDEGNLNIIKQRNSLENNKKKIDDNKKSADQMNTSLGKKIDKNVTVKTNKDAEEENRKWSKPIQKVINFFTKGEPKAYAKGTDYHPGGPAIVGEEGPELARISGRMQLLRFGMYDLPRGTEVFTADETQEMLGKSSGRGSRGTGNNDDAPIIIKPAPIYLDGRVIGEAVFETVDRTMSDNSRLKNHMRGV